MSEQGVTRRALFRAIGLAACAAPLLQACGGTASAPAATAAAAANALQTAAKASATKAAAAPAATAATAPTTAAAAAQPVSQGSGTTALSIATYAGPGNDWQRHWAQVWAKQHPDVKLSIVEVPYGDMPQKQLTELATGTMQDVVFSGIKWFPYSASKGAFRAIDDYIKQKDPGLSDFFPTALAGAAFEGKQFGLPYLMHPGNNAIVIFNKNLMAKKNLKIPTDNWTMDEYAQLAQAATDPAAKTFGTNYFPNTYYDFCSVARSYGGDDLSKDGKQFTFATDPKSVQGAHWAVDIRVKYKAAPSRADSKGIDFPAGRLATTAAGTYAILGLAKTIGNKFPYDVVLFPKGPVERGYQGFVECFSIFSKSKQPELAYDLVTLETSKEAGIWSVVNNSYQPSGRKSVWAAPEIAAASPIFKRALEWMSTVNGPFPVPYNLRYQELEDKWENVSQPLFYGEVAFQDGMNKVQKACEAIVALGRP